MIAGLQVKHKSSTLSLHTMTIEHDDEEEGSPMLQRRNSIHNVSIEFGLAGSYFSMVLNCPRHWSSSIYQLFLPSPILYLPNLLSYLILSPVRYCISPAVFVEHP